MSRSVLKTAFGGVKYHMLSKKRRSPFFVVPTNRYATRHRSINKGAEWMGCNVYACNRRIKCMYVHVRPNRWIPILKTTMMLTTVNDFLLNT